MTGSLDPQATLERALDVAMEVFEADRASVYFYEPDSRRLRPAASRNLSAEFLDAVQRYYTHVPLDPGEERSVYVADASEAPFVPELQQAIRREGLRSTLVLPLRTGGAFLGTFVLHHDHLRRYSDEETSLAQTFADQAAIAIQHARLFEAERRASEQASTILEATRTVTSTLELAEVLTSAARCIAAALGQRSCIIWLLDEEEATLAPVSDSPDGDGTATAHPAPVTVQALPAPLRALLHDGRPLVVETPARREEPDLSEQRGHAFHPYVAVPLAARDRGVGIGIVPVVEHGRRFDEDDMELASAVARSAALAVENARLYEQSRRLAVSEERNRLARELHDSVTHSLFSMTLISQALPRIMERDQARARERIDRLTELGRGALAEMRALIFELRPAALAEEGLVAALTKHIAAFESRESIAIDLAVEGERRLPYAIEETLFRVAQEALNNVAKHARAGRVALRLVIGADAAELTVADNGRGFNPSAASAGRRTLGMTSMRERAALAGGTVTIDSAPGRGATVHLRVPLGDEGGAPAAGSAQLRPTE